jgi:protein-L-isoaspartate(D-aspartate) O-methyltransferase
MSQAPKSDASLEHDKQVMLRKHLQGRGIVDRRVLDAMARVPRERFLDESAREDAYADRALAIACGQTISQPYIVALMTEALALRGSERVLEIGTGSGYQTAILTQLAAYVVTIERHEALSRHAGAILAELGCTRVKLVVGDGSLGWPPEAPYDRIVVTAAAATPPQRLIEQLTPDGALVIPLGDREQQMLQVIRKSGDRTLAEPLSACRFVPLVGVGGWPEA